MATESKEKETTSFFALEEELASARLEIAKLQRELDISRSNQGQKGKKHPPEFWAKIWNLLNNRENDTIKDLINAGQLSVNDTTDEGFTLLTLATRKGNAEICQLCVNLDADLDHVDETGRTPLDWSVRNAYFNCEQVLRFAKMGAIVGTKVKESANQLNEERGILQNIIKYFAKHNISDEFGQNIVNIMKDIIEAREIFSPDLLNLAWYFDVIKPNIAPSRSSLYSSIRKTCKNVIRNKDERDWWWIKNYMVPSALWLKEGDKVEEKKDGDTRAAALYNELMDIVAKQEEIELMELQAVMDSNGRDELVKLSKWGDEYKEKYDLRQDRVPNGVKANYTKEELSRKAMPSPNFDLHGHYNYNEYLSRLIMAANMMDEDFQNDLEVMLGQKKGVKIEHDLLNAIYFRHGPVKTMQRSLAKAQTDYFNEDYPTSAKIIDLNRCKIVVGNIPMLLDVLRLVEDKIKYGQAGCIIDIVRVKNGFKEYIESPCYADIKFNVLIKGGKESLIGEIQFLLKDMNDFKADAHRLYTIHREKDLFDTIWKVLPLLTNDKTRTFTAGQNNDISGILDLMVVNNRSMEDILFVSHSKETIINTLCCKGLFKTFEFIMKKADKALFLDRMNMPHQYNETSVECTIWGNQIKILKRLFECNPELLQDAFKDNTKLFRWVYCLMQKPGNHVFLEADVKMFDHVMDLLKLDDKQWQMLLTHRAPREKEGDFVNARSHIKYHIEQLFVLAVKAQKTPVILQLLEKRMSTKVFVDGLFVPDFYNKNAIEQSVRDSKMDSLKYLLDKKEVMDRIGASKNNEALYRLLYTAYAFADDETLNYVVTVFKISQDDLLKFIGYKYPVQIKKGTYFSAEYDEWFSSGSLLVEAVSSGNMKRVQQLLDLVKSKDGKNLWNVMQRKGRGGKTCLVVCGEKEYADLGQMILDYVEDKKNKESLIKSCDFVAQKNENAKKVVGQWK